MYRPSESRTICQAMKQHRRRQNLGQTRGLKKGLTGKWVAKFYNYIEISSG